MKNKNIVVNLILTSVIGVIVLFLSIFGIFDKLDFRLYDRILHLKKDPELSKDISVIAIDDNAIKQMGEWPWSRDIFADSLIYLKEIGAHSVVFDIEYISPSKLALAKNSLYEINDTIEYLYGTSLDIIDGVISYSQYGTTADDIAKIKNDLVNDALTPQFEKLAEIVEKNISFDNDEYFGKAIQFFGNTFLTINNANLEYEFSEEELNFIKDRLLLLDVTDKNEYIKNDNNYSFLTSYHDLNSKGFTPAMHTLVKRSKGLGFTNSNIDSDGTRRRIELIYEYDGKYYAQLVFEPILKILDTNKLTRYKNCLIIENALVPGTEKRQNIKIPLDNHGNMLINWQHETSNNTVEDQYFIQKFGIPTCSLQHIYSLSNLEFNIDYYLSTLINYVAYDVDGTPFEYWNSINNLYDYHKELINMKNNLLDLCTGYDSNHNALSGLSDSDFEQYYMAKSEFFNQLKDFINSDSPEFLKKVLIDPDNPDENNVLFCESYNDLFANLKDNSELYMETLSQLQNLLQNKLCIVGMTAASTSDLGAIPFEKQYANVYIHANVANTILTGNFIKYFNWWYSFIITIVLLYLSCLLANKSSTFQNIGGAVFRLLLILIFILLPVLLNIYIPFVGSVVFMSLSQYIAGIIYRYLLSSRERRYITEVASSFANKDTVEQLRKHPEKFKTVGEKKNIIALFSDVQKFSTLSESLEKIYGEQAPMKLCEILNSYLGELSNQILANNGTIDKYEGDAIVAMFGAPDPDHTHTFEEWAYISLDSAIRMKKAEVEFNEKNPELFEPHEIINKNGEKEIVKINPLKTRIGLNAGSAYTGLMGSSTPAFKKLNYTMMGDTVNLASRLEGGNKPYNTWIMCSEDTWKLADTGTNKGKITVRKLDRIRVVGRVTPVEVYNVIGFTDELSELVRNNAKNFNEAIELYFNGKFTEAKNIFTNIYESDKNDPTPEVFIKRCDKFITEGVPSNWDGVWTLSEK